MRSSWLIVCIVENGSGWLTRSVMNKLEQGPEITGRSPRKATFQGSFPGYHNHNVTFILEDSHFRLGRSRVWIPVPFSVAVGIATISSCCLKHLDVSRRTERSKCYFSQRELQKASWVRWHFSLILKYTDVKGRASHGYTTMNKREDPAYSRSG